MDWIDRNKKMVRACLMAGLLAAFLGPWAFELLNVPAEFPCQAPIVRLYGDFCGSPLPGSWFLVAGMSGFSYVIANLLAKTVSFQDVYRDLIFSLSVFLLVLPFFSTLILILRGDRRGWQIFDLIAWCLAAALGLLVVFSRFQVQNIRLWGVWLYVGVAVLALVLEIRWLRLRNSETQER